MPEKDKLDLGLEFMTYIFMEPWWIVILILIVANACSWMEMDLLNKLILIIRFQ